MNYSILVLGASISISLFIRICCALETNALYEGKSESGKVFQNIGNNGFRSNSEELLMTHEEYSYPNYVYQKLSKKVRKARSPGREGWTRDLNSAKKRIKRSDIDTWCDEATNPPSSFDPAICGSTNPPTPQLCVFNNCTRLTELPIGCDYNDESRVVTCTDVDITHVQLPSELLMLKLNGSKNQISIPEYAFHNVSITQISINSIDYIDPWAFVGVNNLKMLSITNTRLTNLTYDMYVGLNETVTLHLQNNQISWEPYEKCPCIQPLEEIRVVLPKLEILNLTGNPLVLIPYQMFAGLRESPIRLLELKNCYLRRIHRYAFTFIPGLKVLNLSGNMGITDEKLTFLQPLTNLEVLYLEGNGLYTFPSAISGLKQLQNLDLSSNEFISINKGHLSDLTNLVELKLDNCKIRHISDDAFDGNTKLTAISLKNNRLSQIPANFPASLTTLVISREDGTFIEFGDGFHDLPNLTRLELANVNVNTIPTNNAFNGMTSLTRLFLDACNIQSIEGGAFQNLSKLTTLSLTRNSLSQFPPEAFKGLDDLTTLNMEDCQLTFSSYSSSSASSSLPPPFKYLPKLSTLKLSGNKIKNLSSKMFQNLTSLKFLYLNRQPIQSWNTRLFPDRIPTVYNLTGRGEIYNFEVEINQGDMQFLTGAMIEDFLRMTKIDLTSNNFICGEGACKLQEAINEAMSSYRQTWVNQEDYFCSDTSTSTHYKIMNVTEEVCQSKVDESDDDGWDGGDGGAGEGGSNPENSSTVTKLIIIAGSLSLVAVVIILLAYRNRVHLRYFWFKAKFNVMPVNQRKSKVSTTESGLEYDYDVFISYHNEDSKFIADVFLPEIEQQESKLDGGNEIMEAKNEIFLIENDKASIVRNAQSTRGRMDNSSKQQTKFKVCLHERDFEAGVPIAENIVDCVDRSRKMIIFVSKQYMESQWCSYEMNLVYHRLIESRRKSFALVLLEDIPSELRSKVLNYLMVTKTYLQWPGMGGLDEDKSSFWRRLRAFLQSGD